jgi:hypothetical protein
MKKIVLGAGFHILPKWHLATEMADPSIQPVAGALGPVVQRNLVTILVLNQLDLTEGFNAKLYSEQIYLEQPGPVQYNGHAIYFELIYGVINRKFSQCRTI